MVDRQKADDLFWWVCGGAQPTGDGRKIISEICERLVDLGVPIDRFALFLFTLHPTIKGRRLTWSPQQGVEIAEAEFDLLNSDEYHDNPLRMIAKTRKPMRLQLSSNDCRDDYLIVNELRSEGYSDYYCQPLVYVDGDAHTVSWSTKDPGGFSEDAISVLEQINLPLARITESYVLRLNASWIISTYVGRNAGDRILNGQIKQGDGEDISAVILFADLKDFTTLSNNQSNQKTLEMLNKFFVALEKPIEANGGEILKFMGDGLLAIFPFAPGRNEPRKAINSAYSSLTSGAKALKSANDQSYPFRAAIHLGDIHYGNIGGFRRLDFTAIGPAVNLTARLLAQASNLEAEFVCSKEAAEYLGNNIVKNSTFMAKGFDQEQHICALRIK